MSDKVIGVRFNIDERGAARMKAIVEDLTKSVERLNQASNKAGQAFQIGQQRGGGIGPSVTPGSRQAGPGAALGGIVGSVLGGDSAQIRGVASAADQAFKSTSNNVSQFVGRAENDLSKLSRRVEEVTQKMTRMRGGGGPRSPSGAVPWGDPSWLKEEEPYSKIPWGDSNDLQERRSTFTSTHARLLRHAAGFATGALGGGGLVGGIIGSELMSLGPAGWALQAGISGIKLADAGAHAYYNNRSINTEWQLGANPGMLSDRAASAQPFQQLFRAARGGDVATTWAFGETLKRPELLKSLVGSQDLRKEMAERLSGYGGLTLDYLKNKIGSFTGKSVAELVDSMSGDARVGHLSREEITKQLAVRALGPKQAGQFSQSMADVQATADPRFLDAMNYVTGGSASNLATRRAGFWGVPKGREALEYGMEQEADSALHGRTRSERGAARRAIVTGAGMGYLGQMGDLELLSAQEGGLANPVSLMRAGGILGGSVGAGGAFYRQVQHRGVGRHGLDVASGNELFGQLVSRGLGMGNAFGAGDTFSTLASSAASLTSAGGIDAAEQQRRIGMLGVGMGRSGGFTGGSYDPLNTAMATVNWTRATGGHSYLTRRLMHTDPSVLTAIANGGQVPNELLALAPGKTAAERAAFIRKAATSGLAGSERQRFAETIDLIPGSPAATLMGEFRGSGKTIRQFLDQKTSGLHGRAAERERMRLRETLGSAAQGGTEDILAMDLVGVPGMGRTGGAHSAGAQGLEVSGTRFTANERHRQGSALREFGGKLPGIVGTATSLGDAGRAGINDLGASGFATAGAEAAKFARVLIDVVGALKDFKGALQQVDKVAGH